MAIQSIGTNSILNNLNIAIQQKKKQMVQVFQMC